MTACCQFRGGSVAGPSPALQLPLVCAIAWPRLTAPLERLSHERDGALVIAVFDGHNDALTREDHARLGDGRDGGHLDLPRMRAGGIRGGIFAVFSWSG